MNYKTYSSEGVVIGRRSYKEADRVLTLFTRDLGKVVVLAKGVRKLTSRKRSGIEIFNKIKFSAVTSDKSFDILTEVEILNSYDVLRKDLKQVSVAYYFCEVIDRVMKEKEKSDESYGILSRYLEELETSINLKTLRLQFVEDVLVTIGFWPYGKKMSDPDAILEEVVERKINSTRVGKRMLQRL